MNNAHCYYCGKPTSTDNLFEVDGGITRICEECQKLESVANIVVEDKKPQFQHKSFDPNASWLAELQEIDKEQENLALVDETQLIAIYKELNRLQNQEKEFKKQLLEKMESHGVKSIKTDLFTITLTPEHITNRLDQAALQAENPELYNKYIKQTIVKSAVKITLKKEQK